MKHQLRHLRISSSGRSRSNKRQYHARVTYLVVCLELYMAEAVAIPNQRETRDLSKNEVLNFAIVTDTGKLGCKLLLS
jgi:hypothetical protein